MKIIIIFIIIKNNENDLKNPSSEKKRELTDTLPNGNFSSVKY